MYDSGRIFHFGNKNYMYREIEGNKADIFTANNFSTDKIQLKEGDPLLQTRELVLVEDNGNLKPLVTDKVEIHLRRDIDSMPCTSKVHSRTYYNKPVSCQYFATGKQLFGPDARYKDMNIYLDDALKTLSFSTDRNEIPLKTINNIDKSYAENLTSLQDSLTHFKLNADLS